MRFSTLRSGGAFMVQREQALQEFRIGQSDRPTIGRKHRRVQLPMRRCQPTRARSQGAALVRRRGGVGRSGDWVPLWMARPWVRSAVAPRS